jgi:hypothetical protein
VNGAGEGEVDPVVDEPVAAHPVPDTGLAHQVHRALFQHACLDRLLDVLPCLHVDHHRFDAALVQQVGQHQPGRAGADNSNLCTHGFS